MCRDDLVDRAVGLPSIDGRIMKMRPVFFDNSFQVLDLAHLLTFSYFTWWGRCGLFPCGNPERPAPSYPANSHMRDHALSACSAGSNPEACGRFPICNQIPVDQPP